jgi:hypothetical protein
MRLKCFACEALARPVYLCAAQSPHIVDVELLRQGLHDQPTDLRAKLQMQIDATRKQDYDAIVLAYGLCGKATEGLGAREIPLVIPRAHDCITLFLGSRARYQAEFENNSGTYWYALDYVERGSHSDSLTVLGASGLNNDLQADYAKFVAKYGKDNADYLMQVMGAWQKHYQRAAFIDLGVGNTEAVEAKAQTDAAQRGWTFARVAGDMVLIRRLLNGDWKNDFLMVNPGEQVAISYDDQVVCAIRG